MKARELLRQFLKDHQDRVSDPATAKAVQSAIAGLEKLDFGQVDEIFTPIKSGLHGAKPFDVKQYIAHAIGSIIALKRVGYKVLDAEQKAAEAYGVTSDVVHQWRPD